MDRWQGLLDYSFGNNSLRDYLMTLATLLVLLLIFKLFENFFLKKLEKFAKTTKTDVDDELVKILEDIPDSFYTFLAFYIAVRQNLVTPPYFAPIMNVILIVLTIYLATRVAHELINFSLTKAAHTKGETKTEKTVTFYTLNLIVKIILWSTAVLLILSNLGVNISTLLASLGIGGIAVALAAQNILTDIFSSFSIYFDKPFEIGDLILVGTDKGIVRKIGLKTTRLESLEGEELVIPNRELTGTRIFNYKRMKHRRVTFQFGVAWTTPAEKLKRVPGLVRAIIEGQPDAKFERAHLQSIGTYNLVYEVVYFVLTRQYNEYMDLQQDIYINLKSALETEGIAMALPTQTVHVDAPQHA